MLVKNNKETTMKFKSVAAALITPDFLRTFGFRV